MSKHGDEDTGKGARKKQLTKKGADLHRQNLEKQFKKSYQKFRTSLGELDKTIKNKGSLETVERITSELDEEMTTLSRYHEELATVLDTDMYQQVSERFEDARVKYAEVTKHSKPKAVSNTTEKENISDAPEASKSLPANDSSKISENRNANDKDDCQSLSGKSRSSRGSRASGKSRQSSSSHGPEAIARAAALHAKL